MQISSPRGGCTNSLHADRHIVRLFVCCTCDGATAAWRLSKASARATQRPLEHAFKLIDGHHMPTREMRSCGRALSSHPHREQIKHYKYIAARIHIIAFMRQGPFHKHPLPFARSTTLNSHAPGRADCIFMPSTGVRTCLFCLPDSRSCSPLIYPPLKGRRRRPSKADVSWGENSRTSSP
jgi:hypothetical protein